jgi:hypothetical protein
MTQTFLFLICGLVALSHSFATDIKVPPASLSLFQTEKGKPKNFEIKTTSSQGSMVYGEGTMTISSNGTVNGTMDLTIFAKDSSESTLIKKVPLTGKISRPRLLREKNETGANWAIRRAIYVVDFSAKTITSKKNKAPIYSAKGVFIYSYFMEHDFAQTLNDYSFLYPKISVFGPNGEIGDLLNPPQSW